MPLMDIWTGNQGFFLYYSYPFICFFILKNRIIKGRLQHVFIELVTGTVPGKLRPSFGPLTSSDSPKGLTATSSLPPNWWKGNSRIFVLAMSGIYLKVFDD